MHVQKVPALGQDKESERSGKKGREEKIGESVVRVVQVPINSVGLLLLSCLFIGVEKGRNLCEACSSGEQHALMKKKPHTRFC